MGRAALVLSIASIVSRVLGVLRDRLLAITFGAGGELDAYYAAFRLPDTVYNLLILGALSAGFLPVLADIRAKRGNEEAMNFASLVYGWFVLALVGLAIMGCIFAPQLVPLMVHGFAEQQLTLAVQLTRILFFSPVLLGVSAIYGGVLQSAKKTLAFAFAPVLYNVGIIFGISVLTRTLGVAGVALGVLVGAVLHVAVQARGAYALGIHWPVSWRWTADLRRLFFLTGPRLAALGASQVSLAVILSLASTLRAGSVSVFQLANNLQSFPLGVIGISFAMAAFPLLSEAAGGRDWSSYHRVLGKTARRIAFFLIPVSLLFVLLRAQLVRLVLGDGEFDWTATVATAEVVGWLAISLTAQALIPLLARAFYALQSTWTPFSVTVIGEVLMLALAWQLRHSYGIAGLAMAFSAATFFQVIALWMALRRRVGADSEWEFVRLAVLAVIVSIPALTVAWGMRQLVGTWFPLRTFWQVALQFGVAATGAGAVYLAIMYLMNTEESHELVDRVKRLVS